MCMMKLKLNVTHNLLPNNSGRSRHESVGAISVLRDQGADSSMDSIVVVDRYVNMNLTDMEEEHFYSRVIPNTNPSHGINNSQRLDPLTVDTGNGSYKEILLGYALPIIIVFTAFLNVFVFVILVKPVMKSSVNVILAGLALFDTLTGLSVLPHYIFQYAFVKTHIYTPFHWCYVQKLCSGILPTIFHTISVWLTFALAVQRYIYLCHPLRAKTMCTIERMVNVVVAMSVCSFLLHGPRLFDSSFVKIAIKVDGKTVDTCTEVMQVWALNIQHIYYPVYYWVRVIGIHLIPSIGLAVLNLILIHVMRSTNKRRRFLILQNRSAEWKKVRETNCTTFMLIIVVTIFLLVELPMGIYVSFILIQNNTGFAIIPKEYEDVLSVSFNFLILLSYPLNFFLYIIMSKKFRSEILRILLRRKTRLTPSGTMQTSRDKSTSMELMKSIFTVMSVPPRRRATKVRRTSDNSNSNSSISTKSQNNDHGSPRNNNFKQEWINPACECPCVYCVDKCQQPKQYVDVATYAKEFFDE